ncbi:hypothetical protein Sango_3048600 [Sesamum angolense]|uniref:Uncharacterized protein n=1 Tax=Sesamum angolense TaxID=2727404 RepID=A0AAE1TAT6_9LAMI|nr:hypothetical protein Sango_3048600 [Sesamum angolense]
MAFSHNIEEDRRVELVNILGVTMVPKHDKYLGFSTVAGRSKRAFRGDKKSYLAQITQLVGNKAFLSGRTVLLKIVLQSISIYAMSCFWLLDSILCKLESTMAKFFWHRDGKIGDGHAIPITGHPWLPKPTTFQLISRPNTLSEASTVSSLIKPDDEWNESLISANFYALDAECILGISIGGSQSRDELVWHLEKSGWFSV